MVRGSSQQEQGSQKKVTFKLHELVTGLKYQGRVELFCIPNEDLFGREIWVSGGGKGVGRSKGQTLREVES